MTAAPTSVPVPAPVADPPEDPAFDWPPGGTAQVLACLVGYYGILAALRLPAVLARLARLMRPGGSGVADRDFLGFSMQDALVRPAYMRIARNFAAFWPLGFSWHDAFGLPMRERFSNNTITYRLHRRLGSRGTSLCGYLLFALAVLLVLAHGFGPVPAVIAALLLIASPVVVHSYTEGGKPETLWYGPVAAILATAFSGETTVAAGLWSALCLANLMAPLILATVAGPVLLAAAAAEGEAAGLLAAAAPGIAATVRRFLAPGTAYVVAALAKPRIPELDAVFAAIPDGRRVIVETVRSADPFRQAFPDGWMRTFWYWTEDILPERGVEPVTKEFTFTLEHEASMRRFSVFNAVQTPVARLIETCEGAGIDHVIVLSRATAAALQEHGFAPLASFDFARMDPALRTAMQVNVPGMLLMGRTAGDFGIVTPPAVWSRGRNRLAIEARAGTTYRIRYKHYPDFAARQDGVPVPLAGYRPFDDVPGLRFMEVTAPRDGTVELRFDCGWRAVLGRFVPRARRDPASASASASASAVP